MSPMEECQMLIAAWYAGAEIVTVRMQGGDRMMDELVIQMIVVELLRVLIDNPVPVLLIEGTDSFNTYIDLQYRKALRGLDFGFGEEQESAVKNLAWNYYADGVSRVQANPALKDRLFKCCRGMMQVKH